MADDKWGALRAYRGARGLCYICGERWSKDHVCKQEVQLHVVQEMIEVLQNSESAEYEDMEHELAAHMISISAAAVGATTGKSVKTMQLRVQVQGHNLTFLVDSGSTHSFLDVSLASQLEGVVPMAMVRVKVANGDTVPCNSQILDCSWTCSGHKFISNFKMFPLGSYDGIIGLDWLASHSPMLVDWEHHWFSFRHKDTDITILGTAAVVSEVTVVEVCSLLTTEKMPVHPEVQLLLDQFPHLFEAPTGLPPRRAYDHTIPLLPGATPVSLRPYHLAPALKTKLERQMKEMLASGVIRPSTSLFSSALLMVKKKDDTL